MRKLIDRVSSWRLFSQRPPVESFLQILKWWEIRRIAYNTIVGAAGLLTCATFLGLATVASSIFNEPIEFPDPPLFAVFAVLLYGIAANVCYTGGWLVEWLVGKVWRERAGAFGEISFCSWMGHGFFWPL
jgi:hypothetical protein